MLDALSGALQLDASGREHLRNLYDAQENQRTRPAPADQIRPEVAHLLTLWHEQAALVVGRYRQVLAVNTAATTLNANFTLGENLMREVFLDPDARHTYPDWEQVAAEGVAALRASVGANVVDVERDRLVDDLWQGSPEFAALWSQHDVRAKPSGRQRFHTAVGDIELQYVPFTLPESLGQTLYVFYPTPGSVDEHRFRDLIATPPNSPETLSKGTGSLSAQNP